MLDFDQGSERIDPRAHRLPPPEELPMRKIKLDLDRVATLSFETTSETEQASLPDTRDTCWASCLSACGVCPDWDAAAR
jgi:hypothetical protein